jgi:pilus assembly protein FimV
VFAAQDVIDDDDDDDIDELQPGEPPLDDAISEVISSDQHVESFAKSELAPAEPTEASEEEQGLQLRPLETDDLGAMKEVKAEFSDAVDSQSDDSDRPYTSGLSLEPMEADADLSAENSAQAGGTDESIYGAETDPIDSKLDLARAYIDMGDEDGARPVLMDVIKEGHLGQQAEARELLLRLEAS